MAGPPADPAWTAAAATDTSYTPSASELPTTVAPPKVSTYVRPSADGLPTSTTVPAPAPPRPARVIAPASSQTGSANVTVTPVTRLRCADPSLIVTDCTRGGAGITTSTPANVDVFSGVYVCATLNDTRWCRVTASPAATDAGRPTPTVEPTWAQATPSRLN